MKYTAQFYDINEKLYTLEIGSGEVQNITLSATPFITELETSDSHLYKPCKYSSATIGMITDDYKFDLYSSTAQQNKVVLSSASGIVWVGYVTPNLYSQGYENELEEIEVEAIDALSTLQYYKYTTIGGKKNIVLFTQIINHLLGKCNAYSSFYISDNTQLNATSDFCLPSKMYISEQNFFDEDDEPMTMQEVLEEVCKYLNVTAVADGDKVYFLDYDAIKNGINTYYRFTLGTETPTKVTLQQSKEIEASDYVENGGQLSLDNVYNKVTVKDSLYSFDSIIPSIWDEKYLTNYGGSWSYVQEVNEDGKGGMHKCFFKYLKHKNYTCYYYDKNTLNMVLEPMVFNYGTSQNLVGATICKAFFEKTDNFNKKYNDINFTDYVLLHIHNTYDGQLRPMFELAVNDSNVSFIGGSTYLIIKGNFLFMDREGEMYIMQGYSNKNDDFNPDNLYIDCKLKYGNMYWNGIQWTTTDSTFKLYFDNQGQTDHCINRSFPVKNNITWDMGLEGEGYAIPMPSTNEVIIGKPTFTLYHPHKVDNSYRCDAVWLSNFDIQAKVQNFQKEADKDSDTEYSNIINEDFVNEMDSEEFAICTWDNKECNYSAVCYSANGTSFTYLDNVYNKATKQMYRLEEHLIYRLVTQYSTPSAILNLNLQNKFKVYATMTDNHLPNKKFIVDSIITDYRLGKQEIRLIEKK